MDKVNAILEIVKTASDVASHLIKQVDRGEVPHATIVARFQAYRQSIYDEDRKEAEDILAERKARGEID